MHGRPRVRTTEEQRAAKAKERAAKMSQYRAAMAEAALLRADCRAGRPQSAGPADRLLRVTQALLQGNPDIGTLWVARREALLQWRQSPPQDYDEAKQLDAELQLTAACLLQNPKSYSAWHHRAWTLDQLGPGRADLPGELRLTGQFLQRDERNFHCWDHRRHVARLGGVPVRDELAFSDRLLTANMGNFSAWHYRSRLLGPGMPAEARRRETDTALSAMFSDPADTAPWGYFRWLLAPPSEPLRMLWLRCCPAEAGGGLLMALSRPVSADWLSGRLTVQVGDDAAAVEAPSICGLPEPASAASHVWRLLGPDPVPSSAAVSVAVRVGDDGSDSAVVEGPDGFWAAAPRQPSTPGIDAALHAEQLAAVRQLAQLAGDSRQSLLTEVAILTATEASAKVEVELAGLLDRLAALDTTRAGAYAHERSRLAVLGRLAVVAASPSPSPDALSLAGLGLTALPQVHAFAHVAELDLADNRLVRLPGGVAALALLRRLDCSRNLLAGAGALAPLRGCRLLADLLLGGNPLAEAEASGALAEVKAGGGLPADCRVHV